MSLIFQVKFKNGNEPTDGLVLGKANRPFHQSATTETPAQFLRLLISHRVQLHTKSIRVIRAEVLSLGELRAASSNDDLPKSRLIRSLDNCSWRPVRHTVSKAVSTL